MNAITAAKNIFTLVVNAGRERAVENQRIRAWRLEQQFHAVHAKLPQINARLMVAKTPQETSAILKEISENFRLSSRLVAAWARCVDVAIKVGGPSGRIR
jgi:hypothetical protein